MSFDPYEFDRDYSPANRRVVTEGEYTTRTFLWMVLGLMITFGVAVVGWITNLTLYVYVYAPFVQLAVLIATLVMAFTMSARIEKMSVGTARSIFVAFSALFVCCMAAFRGYFQGHGNMAPTSKSQIVEAAIKLLLGLALAALLPLAVGFAQIIAPFSDATPIMKYAYVLVYMAVLLTADLGLSFLPRPRGGMAVSGVLALCLAGVTLYSANINNLLYTAADQAHRATLSYATRLLTRIESCPGYTGEEEVLIIGSFPTDRIYADIESYALVDHYSVPRDTVAPLNKHIYYYLNDWLNVPIAEPEEETMISVSQSEEFQAMPLYPADGSVQMLDGRVVVKIQEEYTPKSDYELAYENRR